MVKAVSSFRGYSELITTVGVLLEEARKRCILRSILC